MQIHHCESTKVYNNAKSNFYTQKQPHCRLTIYSLVQFFQIPKLIIGMFYCDDIVAILYPSMCIKKHLLLHFSL